MAVIYICFHIGYSLCFRGKNCRSILLDFSMLQLFSRSRAVPVSIGGRKLRLLIHLFIVSICFVNHIYLNAAGKRNAHSEMQNYKKSVKYP